MIAGPLPGPDFVNAREFPPRRAVSVASACHRLEGLMDGAVVSQEWGDRIETHLRKILEEPPERVSGTELAEVVGFR